MKASSVKMLTAMFRFVAPETGDAEGFLQSVDAWAEREHTKNPTAENEGVMLAAKAAQTKPFTRSSRKARRAPIKVR